MASNSELVRRGYDAWNRDDWDAARAMLHPDVEWRSSGLFPGLPGVCHGIDEVRVWWDALKEPWERFTIDIEGTLERAGVVVAEVRFDAVGKESGVAVELRFANVWEFEDGLARRFHSYGSADEARAAVGL